ncbi:Transferase [Pleurostoma richardsiae]|uniref:Transferase n=1 Tax=Pleurostoma richardsiae TaxID=41990 RepID=A0AA38VJQ8_9PEZI|nr:Transferase [Pleurostoma richardsiae]
METNASRFQDVIGQFPQLKSYNQGLMICALDDAVRQESVVTALEAAISQIVAKIPWLGEQVIHEAGDQGTSGGFTTTPWPEAAGPAKLLYVRDCRQLVPSFDEIVRAGGPVSMLDGSILCPLPGFPLSYDERKIGPAPVVAVQVSFIKGGVIINFSNQHNMMDASGVFAFVALLSIAMQGNEIPQSLVDQANLDRSKVIPLLEGGQPVRDHSHLFIKPSARPTGSSPGSPARWAFFRLSRSGVAEIESAASDTLDFDPAVSYVSANDALCAFYWKRLAAVRLGNRSVDPAAVSKFSRAIDARSAVGVPSGYMGQMVYHAATRFTYGELLTDEDLTLSALASRMRADLNESNTEWAVRSYATFLTGVPDKSKLVYGGGINPALDIGSSSMSQGTSGALNFGILGKPALLRRANLTPVPGILYFYPPEPDSGCLPVLVCLSETDLEGLKGDEEWSRYAEFIG